ncbi:MAG: Nif3-like dinuclear metal center hexameric protein [Flavobacteriaceae bacterium]
MKISEITGLLHQWVPLTYAEDFDNVGLLTGHADDHCTGVLIAHDVSEKVVEEAQHKQHNLIVCFHPIIFKGLKSITGKNYVEKTVLKAIENRIAIFALHTALDNYKEGISYHLGSLLGINEQNILIPQKNTLLRLTTYVPKEHKEAVVKALHTAGAGAIGNYDHCSFSVSGMGQFKGNSDSQPHLGEAEKLMQTPEDLISLIVPKHTQAKVLKALHTSHPYEAVAYELIPIANLNPDIGLGSIGQLSQPMTTTAFLEHVKTKLKVPFIRHSEGAHKNIKTVAVLGGSGSFTIDAAMAQGADALVTSDLKYHDFFKAEQQLLLVDAGHYETEHFTKKIIEQFLTKKIPNFAITLSEVNTNPVKYF